MLKFVNKVPEKNCGFITKSKPPYYNDLMTFIESDRKAAIIAIDKPKGGAYDSKELTNIIRSYMQAHGIKGIRAAQRGSAAYLIKDGE
jgi:hypothetical protein